MVFIGFLLIILITPYVPTDINLLYYAGCYVVGLVFHKIVELITPCLRNCPYILYKGYKEADLGKNQNKDKYRTSNGAIKKDIKHDYYDKYYYLQKNNSLGSVPTLEAQSAFLKNLWFVSILYSISIYFPKHIITINMPVIICLILSMVYLTLLVLTYLFFDRLRAHHLCIILIDIIILCVIIYNIPSILFSIQNSTQIIAIFKESSESCKDHPNFSLLEIVIYIKRYYLAKLLFIIIPLLWYSTEKKISYLVWETSSFYKEKEKRKRTVTIISKNTVIKT